jgi:hypothetical protein
MFLNAGKNPTENNNEAPDESGAGSMGSPIKDRRAGQGLNGQNLVSNISP